MRMCSGVCGSKCSEQTLLPEKHLLFAANRFKRRLFLNPFRRFFMKLPSPGFLLHALWQACRRFPGTMVCAVAAVAAVFELIGAPDMARENSLVRLWLPFQLGLPLMTGLVALSESKGWDEKRGWLLQGLGMVVLAGCWFLFDPSQPSFEYLGLPRYITLLFVAHLFVAIAPYVSVRSVRDFWEYNRELFAHIIIGGVFTLILFAGLSLAILAVDQLFDINIQERVYLRLFVLLAGVFNTAYFLFHFPKQYEFAEADAGYNAVFKNLCKFILIPIVLLYFLILYAYGTKILITWNLPRGWVSSLVLGFSVAGIFTYLLNFYLPQYDESAHVRGYKKWFWWVVLPLTVLLFVAIGKRIGDYGVTEGRFLVAHLGVWLAVTCLYFLFSKHDNIKFIPISLALFGAVFAFGPLNAFKVSVRSQAGILENLFEKNGRWKDGRLVQGASDVPPEEVAQISSALRFLHQRDALRRMSWLPMPLDSFPNVISAYDAAEQIMAWASIQSKEQKRKPAFLNVVVPAPLLTADIRGFDSFHQIDLYPRTNEKPKAGDFFGISDNQKAFEWKEVRAGKVSLVESFDLQPALRQWWEKGQHTGYLELDASHSTLNFAGKKGSLRLLLQDADVRKENDTLSLRHLKGYLFVKRK